MHFWSWAAVLFVVMVAATFLWLKNFGGKDGLYLRLIAKLDAITARANAIAKLSEHLNDEKVLRYFEDNLHRIENLLHVVQGLREGKRDLRSLLLIMRMVEEAGRRLKRIDAAVRASLKGKMVNYGKLYDWRLNTADVKGCYFCSRPFDVSQFKIVKTKIHGVTIKVWGCNVCRSQLRKDRKVKVLYFLKKGQPIHWQHVKEYTPTDDFWNLNKAESKPDLKLVFSAASETTELSDDDDS